MLAVPVFQSCYKSLALITAALFLTSCQMTYYLNSAYQQAKLLNKKEPIEKVVKRKSLDPKTKQKLELVLEARQFAINDLGLTKTRNYTSFVQMDRDAVTYVVQAAPAYELKHHLWHFPVVGSMPYKGYFDKADADQEANKFRQKNYDVYLRGVSAYSTLGWLEDPLYSPMLQYKEHDLVETIIHEITHATIFIKSSADFNERLATFVGNEGMIQFYEKKEGVNSPTVALAKKEMADLKVFSQFLSQQIPELKTFYQTQDFLKLNDSEKKIAKEKKIAQIKQQFKIQVLPKLKTEAYKNFLQVDLNNARLLSYQTYIQDLSLFEKVFEKKNRSIQDFMEVMKSFRASKNPEQALKDWVTSSAP